MNPKRGLFVIAALAAFWVAPVFAMEHCDHATAGADVHAAHVAQPDGTGEPQHAHHEIEAVAEEVPIGGEAGESACQHNLGEVCRCKAEMTLSCGMEGCCIKADGPLSSGLNDRLPTNDDHALSIQTALPGATGHASLDAHGQPILPRDLTGPDPRPPSA